MQWSYYPIVLLEIEQSLKLATSLFTGCSFLSLNACNLSFPMNNYVNWQHPTLWAIPIETETSSQAYNPPCESPLGLPDSSVATHGTMAIASSTVAHAMELASRCYASINVKGVVSYTTVYVPPFESIVGPFELVCTLLCGIHRK